MCYDISYLTKKQEDYAKRYGNKGIDIDLIRHLLSDQSTPQYHVSGFTFPQIPIIKTGEISKVTLSTWGLIPEWAKDETIRMKTINAKGETIFEKPSFKAAAEQNRCIVVIDGFFEHQHKFKKTFPYFIFSKNKQPLSVAGLCSTWLNPITGGKLDTCTIVTTKGNRLMQEIHNNPELDEPRMPLVLNETTEDLWLDKKTTKETLQSLIHTPVNEILEAHTVRKLRGKEYLGNVAEIHAHYQYPELFTLF